MTTVTERLTRERVSVHDVADIEESHAMDDRAKVREYTRALRRGDSIPALFVIRLGDKLDLLHGSEQIAAAERLGIDELDAVVFDALDNAESDEVGTVGFYAAEAGVDVWSGLRRAYKAECAGFPAAA